MYKMNLLPKLLICFAVLTLASAEDEMTVKDIAETLMSFAEDCKPKPDEEHIIEMIKNVREPQQTSKCVRMCLMNQFGLFNEEEHIFNRDKLVDMIGSMYSDRKDDLGAIIDECNNKNKAVTENCENTHLNSMCMLDLMTERGFEIPELKDE